MALFLALPVRAYAPEAQTFYAGVVTSTSPAIEDTLERNIAALAKCESNNGKLLPPERYIIDTNGKKSWEELQFQEETWAYYTARYDVELDITNPDDQKKLAYLMLAEDKGNYQHWLNCSQALGFL